MTAFEHAWTLLKQRGHAPLRQESENPQDYLTDDELAHEGLPVEAKDIPLEYDPRIEEQQGRAAEEIEAMGLPSMVYDTEQNVNHPNFVEDEYVPSFEHTEKPPADIGRAGSLSPEPSSTFNPFDPNEVALRRQTMANEQTPLGQALARVRAGSGPRPLQFDQ
jgi:hypothetical protein